MNAVKELIIVAVGIAVVLVVVLPIILTLPDEQVQKLVVANVSEGAVVGLVTAEAGIFFGIPFSQPPIGEYRWRQPRNPVKYTEPYWNATYKRPGCDQICDQPVAEYSCPHETSEDCLYLNIWVPSRILKGTESKPPLNEKHYEISSEYLPGGRRPPLPVVVWFYGGNFRNGAGSCTLYDGRFMAYKGDIIVVTTNYRVAHLGFLIQGTGEEESKGNYGFWDQVKTLEWINKNIAMFGGDPNQVTLFGQSAGAESISIHLTSHVSDHLFQKAIMHSNPFGLPLRNLADARELGNEFTKAANCPLDDMTCLRSRSVKELEKAYNDTVLTVTDPKLITLIFQPWSPVIDGDIVPDQPLTLFAQRREQRKPMIMGATIDEGMIFVAEAFPERMNKRAYKALCLVVFKRDYPKVINMYPGIEGIDNRVIVNDLATEYLFECPQRQAINTTGTQRWLYTFNQTWSFYEAWEVPLCYDKVCHAGDLAYLFGIETLTTFTYTDVERDLSDRFIKYWSNFAKYGNPNNPSQQDDDLVEWPMFDWGTDKISYKALHLGGAQDYVIERPYQAICDFWDDLDAYAEHF